MDTTQSPGWVLVQQSLMIPFRWMKLEKSSSQDGPACSAKCEVGLFPSSLPFSPYERSDFAEEGSSKTVLAKRARRLITPYLISKSKNKIKYKTI